MKRPRNFERINSEIFSLNLQPGYAQYRIELDSMLNGKDKTGIFVMTDDRIHSRVLYFVIEWSSWMGESTDIKLHFVPHGEGRVAAATRVKRIDISNLRTVGTFVDWIADAAAEYDSILK